MTTVPLRSRSSLMFGLAAAWLGGGACATTPPTPPPPTFEAPPPPAPDPKLQPTFTPAPVTTTEARRAERTTERRAIVEAVWQTVRDRHYDPKLGGVDWDAVRRRYEPLALGAPGEAAFYRTLNDMVGELGQSHMLVSGPGAEEGAPADEGEATPPAARPRPPQRRRLPTDRSHRRQPARPAAPPWTRSSR